ncbi:MAG TPA: shikimate dehydrogenase [Solirubrobacteraceae bacterium]|nr:shikimate dehydrogenase [Solirubrobacteraceae bacterium]
MSRLGVLGWPVAHSRSPAMHNAALRALGLDGWSYQRLPVPPELFEGTVRALGAAGFVGANVTIPHKRAALVLADSASAAAREIGAANTLSFTADGIAAENTDAPGLLAAIERAPDGPGSLAGTSALVLGAGGSARAAVWALRQAGARDVAIWNRTAARAAVLADELGARAVPRPQAADIIVNCTSVGLDGAAAAGGNAQPGSGESATDGQRVGEALNQLGLTLDLVGGYSYVVDLVYSDGLTPLLLAARERGVPALDGLEILVAQGALSFELWTGRRAPLDVMRRAARETP